MTHEKLETALRERRVRRLAGLAIGGIVVTITALSVPAFAATRNDSAQSAATITTAIRETTSTSTSLTTSTTATTVPETTTTTTPPLSPAEELAAKISAMTPEEATAFTKFTSPPPTTTAVPKPKTQPKPQPQPEPQSEAAAPQPEAHEHAAPQASSGGAPGGFLACVRQRESKGQYGINTGNGYYGAYQFSQVTWNNTVNHAGRGDLAGVAPSNVSPADQDAMAQHLLGWQGRAPWAGGGC